MWGIGKGKEDQQQQQQQPPARPTSATELQAATRDHDPIAEIKRSELTEVDRDLELENILGNLMIAQYQVDKLRSRLSERVSGYGSASRKKESTHIFKHDNKWFQVRIKVDEVTIPPNLTV